MWTRSLGLISSLLIAWPLHVYAANFTFSFGQANQCDDFQVSWQGGQAPFRLTLVPSFGVPFDLAIPDSDFSNNNGSFSTQLRFNEGRRFLAVMSDATGQSSGGISEVITVGPTTSNAQCNTTDAHPAFFYDTPQALVQCRTYLFNIFDGAVLPATINGFVPGGTGFVLTSSTRSFTWPKVNVASGTTLVFTVVDAQGRQGGATDFTSVGNSDDATCLNATSPTTVSNPPTNTATAAPTNPSDPSNGSNNSSDETSSKAVSPAVLVGAIVGTLLGVSVVGLLIWFFLRRRNRGGVRPYEKETIDLMKGDINPHISPYPMQTSVNSHPSSADGLLSMPPDSAGQPPYTPSGVASSYYSTSGYGRPESMSVTSGDVTSSNGMSRKSQAALAAAQRVVLHRDMDDPPEDEVIELPPQYTERRTPAATTARFPEKMALYPPSQGASGSNP